MFTLYGSPPPTLSLWKIATHEPCLISSDGPLDDIDSVVFSSDNMTLVVAGRSFEHHDELIIHTYDVATGAVLFRATARDILSHCCIALSSDGHLLALGHTWSDPDNRVNAGAALSSSNSAITLYDARTGQEIRKFGPQQGLILSIAFSPDCLCENS
jgi:WD40 repeat protein